MSSKAVVKLVLAFILCGLIFAAGCGGSSKKQDRLADQADQTVAEQPESPQQTQADQQETPEADAPQQQETQAVTEPLPEDTTEAASEPEPEQATEPGAGIEIALKFKPEDSATYKLTTQSEKSVLWEGPAGSKPANFKGGRTGTDVEYTFEQSVQSVSDNGNAVVQITMRQLKYTARVKDSVVLEFDSTKSADEDSPLAAMIGQSYTIEVTPSGEVLRVVDAAEARAAIKGSNTAAKAGRTLLSDDVIKERHAVPALPAGKNTKVEEGGSWSIDKSFNFGMMGAKSYQRVYELKDIKKSKGARVAVAEMSAVPSVEQDKEAQAQAASIFTKMFDNTESYTGKLTLDLDTGSIVEYTEDLKTEWLAVDPAFRGDEQKRPNALRMAALRVVLLEKID